MIKRRHHLHEFRTFKWMKLSEYQKWSVHKPSCFRGGRRSARLVRPFEKKPKLTIIGSTRTLKIQGFNRKWQFWSCVSAINVFPLEHDSITNFKLLVPWTLRPTDIKLRVLAYFLLAITRESITKFWFVGPMDLKRKTWFSIFWDLEFKARLIMKHPKSSSTQLRPLFILSSKCWENQKAWPKTLALSVTLSFLVTVQKGSAERILWSVTFIHDDRFFFATCKLITTQHELYAWCKSSSPPISN